MGSYGVKNGELGRAGRPGQGPLLEDAVFGELLALVVGETQQLRLDPVVVLTQQRPRPVVARRTARDPESVVLIHPRAHRRVRERHEVIRVGDLRVVLHIKRGIAHAANAARDGSYSSAPGALTHTLAGALL